MATNKKLFLILIILILIPLLHPFVFSCISRGEYFYEYGCNQISFFIFSIVPLIGAIILGVLNRTSGYRSIKWYLISAFIIIISTLYLYSLYSLSNFGF